MVLIKLKDIKHNKYNPREMFRGAAMEELKASMKDGGLIQPILVRPINNGKYETVAGERRHYSAEELEWEEIECHVRELNDFEAMILAYSENVLRENLTPIELGRMYKNIHTLIKKNKFEKVSNLPFGEDFESLNFKDKIERVTKQSRVTVRHYISLLKLPKRIQNLIELNHGDKTKGLTSNYGFELARLPKEQMLSFYKIYNPNDYTFPQYQKKVSEKINENKMKGETKRKKLEGNLNKATLELEKMVQRQEAFEERINKNVEKLDDDYDNVEDAIDFIVEQLEEFQSVEKLATLAKDIKVLEQNVDDLDVLIVRCGEEGIMDCPYCLAKINIATINKTKGLFESDISTLREELSEIDLSMDFYRKLKRDLEADNELYSKVLADIKQKEKEIGIIEDAIRKL